MADGGENSEERRRKELREPDGGEEHRGKSTLCNSQGIHKVRVLSFPGHQSTNGVTKRTHGGEKFEIHVQVTNST